jgi:hypothetical protein
MKGGENGMFYNWINVIIGIITIILPIITGVKGTWLWVHIIGGIIIALCAYMANQQAKG